MCRIEGVAALARMVAFDANEPAARAALLRRCPGLRYNVQPLAGCDAAARDEDVLVEFQLHPSSIDGQESMVPTPAQGGACRITQALHTSAASALAALSSTPDAHSGCSGSGSDAPAPAATIDAAAATASAGGAPSAARKACSVCGALQGPNGAKLLVCSGCRKPGLRFCGPEW